jgi:hypothetical protein
MSVCLSVCLTCAYSQSVAKGTKICSYLFKKGGRGANFLKTFAYKNAIKAKLGNLPAIFPESLDPRQKFELPLPWIIKFLTRVHPWSNFKPIGT